MELLHDPKVQRLPADLFRRWINVLCLAAQSNGQLPPLRDIAFALRVTPAEAERTVSRLQAAGLLDEKNGRLTPHNWDKRQYCADHSAERMRRFRARHHVTETPRHGDADATAAVTAPEQSTEQSTEYKAEQSRADPPASPPPADSARHDFDIFRREAEAAGMSGSGPDWDEALLEWRRLDFEQRLAAVAGIRARVNSRDDPALAALPGNYLARRMWERKVRPLKAGAGKGGLVSIRDIMPTGWEQKR